MTSASDGIGRLQLRYFGQVSASISHELKNVLAILNENAGLLQDYAAMAEQGIATHCTNVAEGFEGDLDSEGRRGRVNGWKVRGLPWRQS